MIEIKRYINEFKKDWDDLIFKSKNGTFLFYRDFMDYHSGKFEDHSFLIYRKSKLEGVFVANIKGTTIYSHQGLTYGGLIFTKKLSVLDVLDAFEQINNELKSLGIKEVIYKPVPYIYHKYPAQEDIYALFRFGAKKIGCNISSTIYQKDKLSFIESRKSGIRKAKKENVEIIETNNLNFFWQILDSNLFKGHGVKPVHTIDEIEYLHSKFPENIKAYNCIFNSEVVGGCVVFVNKDIIHVQYISANEKGKSIGAIDLLFDTLINDKYKDFEIFDFGQSTESDGNYLNENLIFQKEGFGGRGITYDTYKYYIND